MSSKILLFLAFLFSCILLSLHLFALEYFLYWAVPWFDILLHIIGGISFGFLLLFIANKTVENTPWYIPIVGTLVAASVWEIFEFQIGQTFVAKNLVLDTISDVAFSIFGGFIAFIIYRFFRMK